MKDFECSKCGHKFQSEKKPTQCPANWCDASFIYEIKSKKSRKKKGE